MEILTEDGERDVSFEKGGVVPRPTRIPAGVRRSHLLRVNRLVRALRVQDKVALATWPRVRPVVLVPATTNSIPRRITPDFHKILLPLPFPLPVDGRGGRFRPD